MFGLPHCGHATSMQRLTTLSFKTIRYQIVFVHEGSGKIVVDGKEYLLNAGDVILIDKNEKFYWDGKMTLHISCTPAFTPEQHVHIEAV